jgi:hypothetical protein
MYNFDYISFDYKGHKYLAEYSEKYDEWFVYKWEQDDYGEKFAFYANGISFKVPKHYNRNDIINKATEEIYAMLKKMRSIRLSDKQVEIVKNADVTGGNIFQRGMDYLIERERKFQDERANSRKHKELNESGNLSGRTFASKSLSNEVYHKSIGLSRSAFAIL